MCTYPDIKKNLEQRGLESHPELAKSCINGKALVSQMATSNENSLYTVLPVLVIFVIRGERPAVAKTLLFFLYRALDSSALSCYVAHGNLEWHREQGACVCLFHWPSLSTPLIVFFGEQTGFLKDEKISIVGLHKLSVIKDEHSR